MKIKEYLLDANIIIKLWSKYPQLLDDIDNAEGIDFKIPQDIAGELSKKEFNKIEAVPVLTSRFIKLLPHIIYNDEPGTKINKDQENKIYIIKGNKISLNDYNLINICEKNRGYVLVTEDKKIQNTAKLLLDSSRVLTFNEFVNDLKKIGIL